MDDARTPGPSRRHPQLESLVSARCSTVYTVYTFTRPVIASGCASRWCVLSTPVVGDEILKGRVQDTNSHYLCQQLWLCGVRVSKVRTTYVRTLPQSRLCPVGTRPGSVVVCWLCFGRDFPFTFIPFLISPYTVVYLHACVHFLCFYLTSFFFPIHTKFMSAVCMYSLLFSIFSFLSLPIRNTYRLHNILSELCPTLHPQVVVVADDLQEIAEEVRRFSSAYDFVLTTGGVGPTHDDVTIEGKLL